jgi:glucosylceramidase
LKERIIRVIQTAKDTQDRLTEHFPLTFVPDTDGRENQLINVYDDVQYQVIEGFGGALTEAAAVTIARMSEEKQREIIEAYFDPERGIGYTLCRTHMQSCDFSLGNYAYVEDEDPELRSFNLNRDIDSLIRPPGCRRQRR